MLRLCFLLSTVFGCLYIAQAQCINTFPYNEGFEADHGNWTSGGTGTDWAWGQVSKNTITQAATGNNCWVTGGLTGSSYGAQTSFVQSPCFDFTGIQYPYVSFSVNWETEKGIDGGAFQYSTDGGNTWQIAGNYVDCQIGSEFYNDTAVANLSPLSNLLLGWSGSVQTSVSCPAGAGSNGWTTMRQCMPYLVGETNVAFRIIFGTNSQCNSYDGLAFDDVYIGEAPPISFDFTYSCLGPHIFTTLISEPRYLVVCFDTVVTAIDDNVPTPNVGLLSMGMNMDPVLQLPGIYPQFPHRFSFTFKGPCHAPVTVAKVIPDFDVTAAATPVTCYGANDGELAVAYNTANIPKSISWLGEAIEPHDDTSRNLPPGDYRLLLVDSFNCKVVVDTLTITEPDAIDAAVAIIAADTCYQETGAATSNAAGGTPPYTYLWSNSQATNTATDLGANHYTITITDANNCSATGAAIVPYLQKYGVSAESKDVSCEDTNSGSAAISIVGGDPPFSYLWSNNNTAAIANNLEEGQYLVTITDAANCSATAAFDINKETCAEGIYLPTGFSPNNDNVNDVFRATSLSGIDKFSMRIYNRWGELVFQSTSIHAGWDGMYKGMNQPLGVYTWQAEYRVENGELQSAQGNVTLIR